MKIQNIETKRKGLRCPIRVINHEGDGTLTTFDPAVEGSTEVATQALQDFWGQCVDEFSSKGSKLTPTVAGKLVGETDFGMISGKQIMDPNFDVGVYEDIMVQPVPLSGG